MILKSFGSEIIGLFESRVCPAKVARIGQFYPRYRTRRSYPTGVTPSIILPHKESNSQSLTTSHPIKKPVESSKQWRQRHPIAWKRSSRFDHVKASPSRLLPPRPSQMLS